MFICQHIATPPVLQCVKYDLCMRVYCSANPNVSFAPERGLHRKGEKGVYKCNLCDSANYLHQWLQQAATSTIFHGSSLHWCHGLVLPWSLHGEDEHKSVSFWSNRYRAHHDAARKYDDSDVEMLWHLSQLYLRSDNFQGFLVLLNLIWDTSDD